jgi:acetolactate synthase-1/2/3 large subunit
MHELSRYARGSSAFVVDVGQHQMWAAQSLEVCKDQRFLTSGGMGAMGFALPSAIGAYFANPGQSVTMIAGDGGFQLNLQELQTVFRNQIPLKMIILNNQCHGMVRQFQESYFESRYQSTFWGYSAPDFVKIAQAYGIETVNAENATDVEQAMKTAYADESRPYLLQVMIDPSANAYPKMAFGRPMNEMEPDFIPLDMEGT